MTIKRAYAVNSLNLLFCSQATNLKRQKSKLSLPLQQAVSDTGFSDDDLRIGGIFFQFTAEHHTSEDQVRAYRFPDAPYRANYRQDD